MKSLSITHKCTKALNIIVKNLPNNTPPEFARLLAAMAASSQYASIFPTRIFFLFIWQINSLNGVNTLRLFSILNNLVTILKRKDIATNSNSVYFKPFFILRIMVAIERDELPDIDQDDIVTTIHWLWETRRHGKLKRLSNDELIHKYLTTAHVDCDMNDLIEMEQFARGTRVVNDVGQLRYQLKMKYDNLMQFIDSLE